MLRTSVALAIAQPVFFCLFSPVSYANTALTDLLAQKEKIRSVSESSYWRRLLHYTTRGDSPAKSEIDDSGFFLSAQGKTDAESELVETLKSFYSDRVFGVLKQKTVCAYPERYRYLNEVFRLGLTSDSCSDFHEWKKTLNAESATLVFASAYFNNPASMFGHTFLKINSRKSTEHASDLLNYGVNYAADTGTDGGMAFAWKGLFGGYHGNFSMLPYYQKIQEYSTLESRDLWLYELSLSSEELDRMLNHLWEMGSTWFYYYFFNRNCSYQILSLLEVAKPDWNLTDRFTVSALPAETVRAVTEIAGSVRKRTFRPALFSVMRSQYAALEDHEKKHAREYFASPEKFALQKLESARLADALISFETFESTKRFQDPELNERRRKLLVRRSRLETLDSEIKVAEGLSAPEEGFADTKISAAFHRKAKESWYSLKLRPVYHDMLERDIGYSPYSEIVLSEFELGIHPNDERTFKLEQWTLVRLISLAPKTPWSSALSWTIDSSVKRLHEPRCSGGACSREPLIFQLSGGPGLSQYIDSDAKHIAYAFLKTDLRYSGVQKYSFDPTILLDSGVYFSFGKSAKALIKNELHYFFFSYESYGLQDSPSLSLSFFGFKNAEFRLESSYDFRKVDPEAHASVQASFFY